jgi:hypothetical protein
MFANLVQLITGSHPTPEIDRHAFVQEVRVRPVERRNRKVERTILICWIMNDGVNWTSSLNALRSSADCVLPTARLSARRRTTM